jgi:DNA-binding NarL/FixJ family response regulator
MCADSDRKPACPAIDRQQVHEALACLYDGLALGQTSLAPCIPGVRELASVSERASRLRVRLLDAMELLAPKRSTSFRSCATRSYEVMTLHFVEGLSMARIAEELSLSERQAYRDLLRAEESLAELLSLSAAEQAQPSLLARDQGHALDAEIQALPAHSQALDLVAVLANVLRTVEPLANRLGVGMACALPDPSLWVSGERGLLSTSLVQMLSAAIRSTTSRQIQVSVRAVTERALIAVTFALPPGRQGCELFSDLVTLASSQHLVFDLAHTAAGEWVASLALPRDRRRVVMVLEDNPSAVELYRRYLADSEQWELLVPPDIEAGLEAARALRPSLIVLDVLMPDQDGWHVLQRVRAQPETADLPVLI